MYLQNKQTHTDNLFTEILKKNDKGRCSDNEMDLIIVVMFKRAERRERETERESK